MCGGEEKIMEYCRQISDEAGKRAAEMFGTEVMDNAESTLTACAFSNVRLPLKMGTSEGEVAEEDAVKVVRWMADHLVHEYDT